jgi:predicted PurR-regulated permease PerM
MIYLFATGHTTAGFLFLLYNLIIVSNVDNIVRSYVVAKRSKISQPVIFIGMVGGLLVFDLAGLIIGPLVLVYFITLLNSYKDKTLYSFFSDENGE